MEKIESAKSKSPDHKSVSDNPKGDVSSATKSAEKKAKKPSPKQKMSAVAKEEQIEEAEPEQAKLEPTCEAAKADENMEETADIKTDEKETVEPIKPETNDIEETHQS